METSEGKQKVMEEGLSRPLSPHSQRKHGGWKSMPYIIGNETFEKLASMSVIANITVYLRTQYHLDGILLVNVVTIWFGTSNFAPLLGAFLSDAYLGRFRTLLVGSFSSLLGMGIMTLTAALPQLRPPTCYKRTDCLPPQKWQLSVLLAALGFLSVGAGGIRPCNIAFGVDQFDARTEKGRRDIETFFDWYYLSFTISLLIAFTVVVYVQTNISWVIGLALPTAFLAISIIVFLFGTSIYMYMKPKGSIFTDLIKVAVAATRKRNVTSTQVKELELYDSNAMEADPLVTKLPHTDGLVCLDKAAVITDPTDELNREGLARNGWRLCSVQQVEHLKCFIRIIPVWLSGITCFNVMDQQSTFGVLQAMQMDRHITRHFEVPPALMGVGPMITLSIWIIIYEQVLIPSASKLAKREVRISMRTRMLIGIIMSILCMAVAGTIEGRRRDKALKNHSYTAPMSFAWLVPQFMLSGLTEAFMAIGIMEFVTMKLPESMRTIAGSIFFLGLAFASYISTLIVNIITSITKRNGGEAWLGGHDLNTNRLDYYYYIIGLLGVLNLIYFIAFAGRHASRAKPAA
ncbi:protein NRT1/ PTR FAMILY 2.8 [Macadamia integrifolia]|uniref:protein NRT1/ PTR FAMILY 2.8 n=1 Tax=Macadamia integrifolia TaxID=60698 RepID=UPI001C500AEE|nr:protein NRT1/ PTR FAMILY 2.8 [Macadamia integrifolia]